MPMYPENKKGVTDKVLSWKSYVPVALVICAGLILSFLSLIGTRAWENSEIKALFDRAAEERTTAIKEAINDRMHILEAVRSFYYASDFVSREEFRTFVTPFLNRVEGIQALEWIPRVLETERAKYEEDAKRDGIEDFKIIERSDRGHMVPVKRRDEYFPVYFVEPYRGNEAAVGFDLASNSERLTALNKARDTGRSIATERITLVQEKEEKSGFLIFSPLFKKGVPVDTVEERRKNLTGFVLGVFHVGDIVESALTSLQSKYIDIYLYDKNASEDKSFLYYHSSRSRKNVSLPDDVNKDNYVKGIRYAKPVEVGGRQWEIVCVTTQEFVAMHRTWYPWVVLAAILIITGILAMYFFVSIRRTARIETLIEERTRQLKESEARIHAILDTAPNGIITISEDGIIESFNPTAEKIFGYTVSEAIGQNVETLIPELLHSKQNEFVAQRKDDSIFPVYVSMGEVQLEDRKIFTAVVHDITKRKQDELALRQAQEAADLASKAKSEFLANMSHEIRTPMSGIIGMSDLLSDTELTPQQKEYIRTVKSSGESLLGIINDILDFSKVEAGQIVLENIPFDLQEVFKNTSDSVGILAANKGLELIWQIDLNVPTRLIGDSFRLRQILVNLINNAIKFTEKGEIAVKVQVLKKQRTGSKEYHISELEKKYVLQFSVRDTGIGLSPEQQKNIFNPFSQADTSTSRKYGGTGLGLSIVKRLVELMGGQIWVESPAPSSDLPGAEAGSIFYFTTYFDMDKKISPKDPDLKLKTIEEMKKPVINKKPIKSLHILLAEDNKINQKVASAMLTKRGHKVIIAENGKEALNIIAHESFDLILMDVQMPEMDGYEATRRIREQEKNTDRHIPIIAMTAHALKGDREKCIASGMDDYISKPIKMQELFKVVEEESKNG